MGLRLTEQDRQPKEGEEHHPVIGWNRGDLIRHTEDKIVDLRHRGGIDVDRGRESSHEEAITYEWHAVGRQATHLGADGHEIESRNSQFPLNLEPRRRTSGSIEHFAAAIEPVKEKRQSRRHDRRQLDYQKAIPVRAHQASELPQFWLFGTLLVKKEMEQRDQSLQQPFLVGFNPLNGLSALTCSRAARSVSVSPPLRRTL